MEVGSIDGKQYEYTNWQNAVNQSGWNVNDALNHQPAIPVMSLFLEETVF